MPLLAAPATIRTVTNKRQAPFVAIVDDDRSVLSALKDLMESAGFPARCFESAEEYLDSYQRSRTACIIADIRMPGMSGLELQAKLKTDGARIPMIVITAHDDAKTEIQALHAGAVAFLTKPFDDEALLEKVRTALKS